MSDKVVTFDGPIGTINHGDDGWFVEWSTDLSRLGLGMWAGHEVYLRPPKGVRLPEEKIMEIAAELYETCRAHGMPDSVLDALVALKYGEIPLTRDEWLKERIRKINNGEET